MEAADARPLQRIQFFVLSPKTTPLYQSGSLEYLQHSVPLALYTDMKKRSPITQESHKKHTRINQLRLTLPEREPCQGQSRERIICAKAIEKKKPMRVTLSSLAPQWSWKEFCHFGNCFFHQFKKLFWVSEISWEEKTQKNNLFYYYYFRQTRDPN